MFCRGKVIGFDIWIQMEIGVRVHYVLVFPAVQLGHGDCYGVEVSEVLAEDVLGDVHQH